MVHNIFLCKISKNNWLLCNHYVNNLFFLQMCSNTNGHTGYWFKYFYNLIGQTPACENEHMLFWSPASIAAWQIPNVWYLAGCPGLHFILKSNLSCLARLQYANVMLRAISLVTVIHNFCLTVSYNCINLFIFHSSSGSKEEPVPAVTQTWPCRFRLLLKRMENLRTHKTKVI